MYGPLSTTSTALTPAASLPDDTLCLHTAVSDHRLEINACFTQPTSNVSDLNARITNLTGRIEALTTQRVTLSDKRDALHTTHSALTSERTRLVTTAQPNAYARLQ